MTFVAVGNRGEGRAGDRATVRAGRGSAQRAGDAGAGARGASLTPFTERVRGFRFGRRVAVTENGQRDTVRGRSPWSEGPASPAAVLAYTRSGAWVPGEQAPWLERLGMLYGYLAVLITVVVGTPLWVVQRPSRLGLSLVVIAILWGAFATGGAS